MAPNILHLQTAALAVALFASVPGVGARPAEAGSVGAATEPALVDTVDVVGARASTAPHEPGLVSIREVGDEGERIRSVADVIERSAGVRVRRFGGLGAPATVSIRGTASHQVAVYVDGIALDAAQFGVANLSDIPLDQVRRVEVYRSGVPARFGDAGLGGVVNVVTDPGSAGLAVNVVGGPEDTWKGYLSGALRRRGFLLSTRYHHLQTRGDFTYLDDRGTTVINEGDDRERTRSNNTVREHALLSRLETPPLLGAVASVQHAWFGRDAGNPGYLNFTFDDAFNESRRHTWQARVAPATPSRVDGAITGYTVRREDVYANPSKETGLARQSITHDQHVDGVRVDGSVALPEWGLVPRASVERRRETFEPTTEGASHEEFERTRDLLHAAVETDLWLWRDRVQLRTAYRYRTASDNYFGPLPFGRPPTERDSKHEETFHAPEMGLLLRPHRSITLRANRVEYARFPTLFELFGTAGEVVTNPELTAEVGTTWDARVDIALPATNFVRGRVEVGVYTSRRDSVIVLLQNGSRGNFKAVNLERAEAEGLEVEASFTLFNRMGVSGSFTTQDVRHVGEIPHWNDRWVPYVSAREGSVEARLPLGRVELRGETIFYGGYYRDPSNRTRVPGRTMSHAGARIHVAPRTHLDIDVRNLGDSAVSDVYGYPMPGRSVFVGLSTKVR